MDLAVYVEMKLSLQMLGIRLSIQIKQIEVKPQYLKYWIREILIG